MTFVGTVRGLLLLIPAWKDAEGDGVEKALVSYHQTHKGDGDEPTTRYAEPTFFRAARIMVMTTLTIGAGGSGGLEAPGVYLGETLAAGWSKVFKRPSADELRLYQLAGIAAAIGTLLEAPFTAALFAAEIVYAGRIVYRMLAYCPVRWRTRIHLQQPLARSWWTLSRAGTREDIHLARMPARVPCRGGI